MMVFACVERSCPWVPSAFRMQIRGTQMGLLTQTSQAIVSPSKEVFVTNLCGVTQDCCDI